MVHICQISLITLSVLSNYLFLYICSEYLMHLCQNIRGGGEKVIISFLWKSFFFLGFFIYERQTSWMWLWEGLTGMDLRMVLIKLYSWSTGGTDWIKHPPGISMHLLFQLLVPVRPVPASPGAEGTRCHQNRSQRPLLLLEMQIKGWFGEFPSRNKEFPCWNKGRKTLSAGCAPGGLWNILWLGLDWSCSVQGSRSSTGGL